MKTGEIRRTFLDYFASKGHTIVPSSPLVPANDATLLFTNAGMVQFKDTFLGLERLSYKRATTAQKCMRVSGKHNDLEGVGPSPRHHTFFEMLGNFSFGDYFKREAISYAWELLTQEFQLPVERLWFTVYSDDDEAARLWQEVGADPQRILRFSEKDNFWAMGDTGPCGPCSEIHYYQGSDINAQRPEGVNSDDDDYMEIWNLVFMQYNRDAQGTMTPLPKPSIDTGLGLERLAAILQGVKSNYETDVFVPIIQRTMALLGKDRRHYQEHRAAYHIVADHSRAIAFLIADGVRPGNEGRNYVLRRILRRAAYHGQALGFNHPFLAETADVVIDVMGTHYIELRSKRDYIKDLVTAEEERFNRTLTIGLHHLEGALGRMAEQGATVLAGREAFTLHDTYGFPLDLTQKILTERGLGVDVKDFEQALHEQQERSRQASQFKHGSEAERWSRYELPATTFTGYKELACQGRVLLLDVSGQQVKLILDRTPFYAESGGQVADTGLLIGPTGRIRIEDVQKPIPGLFVHSGIVEEGSIAVGELVELVVDAERRRDIMRNHTATHLLHRALHDVLGEHAEQAGSLVAPDRLRFDFTHPRQVTPEQLRTIERHVNAWVRLDDEINVTQMSYTASRKLGVMALFGEKYGDIVRVVSVGCEVSVLAGERDPGPRRPQGSLPSIDDTAMERGSSMVDPDPRRPQGSLPSIDDTAMERGSSMVDPDPRRPQGSPRHSLPPPPLLDTTVQMSDDDASGTTHNGSTFCSRELCGGTHVARTGEIGYCCIISEGSISSGLRRIEALTGRAAEEWVEQQRQVTRTLSAQFAAPLPQIPERIDALLSELKGRNAELAALRSRLAEGQSEQLLGQVKQSGTITYIAAQVEASSADTLRQLVEQLRDRLGSGVVVLGTVISGRPQLVVAVTSDLVKQGYHAGKLAQKLALVIGGGGGGKSEMAQVGGRNPEGLKRALEDVGEMVKG